MPVAEQCIIEGLSYEYYRCAIPLRDKVSGAFCRLHDRVSCNNNIEIFPPPRPGSCPVKAGQLSSLVLVLTEPSFVHLVTTIEIDSHSF